MKLHQLRKISNSRSTTRRKNVKHIESLRMTSTIRQRFFLDEDWQNDLLAWISGSELETRCETAHCTHLAQESSRDPENSSNPKNTRTTMFAHVGLLPFLHERGLESCSQVMQTGIRIRKVLRITWRQPFYNVTSHLKQKVSKFAKVGLQTSDKIFLVMTS